MQDRAERESGMDDGMACSIPLWAQKFFESFPWSRARLLAMLMSLPSAEDAAAPAFQLRCPAFLLPGRCSDVPLANTQPPVVFFEQVPNSEPPVRIPSRPRVRPRVLKPTKYGRCLHCQSARRPWIYKTGGKAGQAAWVCTKLFSHETKCFAFELMTKEEVRSQPRYFRTLYSSLAMGLRRGGRATI